MRKEWLEKDYYATLGVSKTASDKEIKKAFRKLARDFHPDNNPDDAVAEARFKEINEAYDTLSDPDERKEYDHAREMGYFVGDPGGHQQYVRVEDLFGGRRGRGLGRGGGRAVARVMRMGEIYKPDEWTRITTHEVEFDLELPAVWIDALIYSVLVTIVWSGVGYVWTWGRRAWKQTGH